MKKLVIFKEEWLDFTDKKKISKADEQKLRNDVIIKTIEKFKLLIKEWIDDKSIQIIKEYATEPWVVIEFDDEIVSDVYNLIRTMDIVDVIDSILPK